MTNKLPRAFAVWFADLSRWSINSFFTIPWEWPSKVIIPLSRALERRYVPAEESETANPRMVTLHFDGEMEPRDLRGKSTLKGKLFLAEAGDLIYSKIDIRNGAIGIVPDSMPRVAVTSEFPVYRVRQGIALPEYIKLLIRTKTFRQQINNMISGTSGRKRVEPDAIAEIPVPLPPIETQQAILSQWQKAQNDIAEAENRASKLGAEIDEVLVKELAIDVGSVAPTRKAFTVWWKEMSRWDVIFAKNMRRRIESARYPILTLQQVILPLRETTGRLTPAEKPAEIFNYIGMENVESISGRLIDFAPISGSEIKSSCVVFDADHILYGKLRPYLRKVIAPQEEGLDRGVASSEFLAIKPNEKVLKEYLLEYLRSSLVAEQASQAIGARMPRVALETFLSFSIPVPDLAKQKAIVDQLKSLRDGITRERETARIIARETEVDTEAYLLGTKKVRTP